MQIAGCSEYLNYIPFLSFLFHRVSSYPSLDPRRSQRTKASVILNIYRTLDHSSSLGTIRFQEARKYRLFVLHPVSYSSRVVLTSVSRNSGLHGVVAPYVFAPRFTLPLLALRPSRPAGSPRAHGTRYRGGSARAQTRDGRGADVARFQRRRNRLHRNARQRRTRAPTATANAVRSGSSPLSRSGVLRKKRARRSFRALSEDFSPLGVPRVCPGGADEDRG